MSETLNLSQPTPEPSAVVAQDPTPAEAVVSPETGPDQPVAPADVASGGLKRVVNTMRYLRTVGKAAELQTTAEVHQAVVGQVRVGGQPQPDLRPVTRSEIRQSKRADRRLRSNMSRASLNYALRTTLPVSKIEAQEGEPRRTPLSKNEQQHILGAQRVSKFERKTIEKARKIYEKNDEVMDKRINRVKKSATGEDIPGRVISARLDRTLARADRLREHLGVVQSIGQPETPVATRDDAREPVAPPEPVVEPIITSPETPTIAKTPEEINFEKLQAMRDRGDLPEPTPKTAKPAVKAPETTPTPESAEKEVLNIAQDILAQADRLIAEQAKASAGKAVSVAPLPRDDIILNLLLESLGKEGEMTPELSARGDEILATIDWLEEQAEHEKNSAGNAKPEATRASAPKESVAQPDAGTPERLADDVEIDGHKVSTLREAQTEIGQRNWSKAADILSAGIVTDSKGKESITDSARLEYVTTKDKKGKETTTIKIKKGDFAKLTDETKQEVAKAKLGTKATPKEIRTFLDASYKVYQKDEAHKKYRAGKAAEEKKKS